MVAPGENIYTIANRYGVTPKDIRKWNGLGSNRVAKGRRLRLHVDNGGVAFASAKTKKTEKDGAVKAGQKATPVVTKSNQTARVSGKSLTYKVQSGDSLYSIAKKYSGSFHRRTCRGPTG